MRSSKHVLLLCSLAFMLQACCLCDTEPTEPPFDLSGIPPGPAFVFGTADFSSSGTVLIKIQVEDSSTYNGSEATIKAWSGNGSAPLGTTAPLPGGVLLYDSGGDVPLANWTTHIARNYDGIASTDYWVLVQVDHDTGGGARQVVYQRYNWTPVVTAVPDSVHEFN